MYCRARGTFAACQYTCCENLHECEPSIVLPSWAVYYESLLCSGIAHVGLYGALQFCHHIGVSPGLVGMIAGASDFASMFATPGVLALAHAHNHNATATMLSL